MSNEIWRNASSVGNNVKIISNTGLDSMTTTLAATITTAAMSTFIEPGIATIDLKVNSQPAIKGFTLRNLLKLKHNYQQSNDFNNPKSRD